VANIDVPASVYRDQVVHLAHSVKTFFAEAPTKDIPDPFDQTQYADFWQEFDSRLARAA